MELSEIGKILDCKVVAGKKNLSYTVEEICAADLMSDVLYDG